MNLQPLSPSPREIGVTEPITPAYERVKQMLFQPFDLAKWITIGFCAWLAGLGEAGGVGSFNYSGGNHHPSHSRPPLEQFRHFYAEARDYVVANAWWLIPLAVALVVLAVLAWLLALWLSSRGKFMFLHCVALDKAEVAVPWTRYAALANSLFFFRVFLGLAGMVVMLPLLAVCCLTILRMVLRGGPDVAGVLLSAGLGLTLVLVSLMFALIHKFMVDFVVPFMYLRGAGCVAAWREFFALLSANVGKFALYILFQIVLSLALGAMVLVAVIATCCLAGCLLLLPFFGAVLLLPVLVFQRAYPLYYLAQYGAPYDVFPVSTVPAAPPPPLAGTA